MLNRIKKSPKSKVESFIDWVDGVLPAKQKPKHRFRNAALVIGIVSAAAAALKPKNKDHA